MPDHDRGEVFGFFLEAVVFGNGPRKPFLVKIAALAFAELKDFDGFNFEGAIFLLDRGIGFTGHGLLNRSCRWRVAPDGVDQVSLCWD